MKKIPTTQINSYLGVRTAKDVFFHGFCLVPKGTVIDTSMVDKLAGIRELVPYLFLDLEEEATVVSPFAAETISQLKQRVKVVLKNYSFEGMEDIETVSGIMESIVSGLFNNQSLSGLNLDTFFIHQPDLYSHCLNTAIISALLAIKSSRFQRWIIEQITLGALLHDVGAAKIADDLGCEWEDVPFDKRLEHPVVGYELLKDNDFLPDAVKKIVLMHHVWERPEDSFDAGKGVYLSYPQSYKDRILMPATKGLPVSIVQVADIFENLTNLSGESHFSKRKAISTIIENAEKIYGEGALLLGTYISPFGVGDEVHLNNNQTAVVIKQTSSPLRPVIKYTSRSEKVIDLRKAPHLKIMDE